MTRGSATGVLAVVLIGCSSAAPSTRPVTTSVTTWVTTSVSTAPSVASTESSPRNSATTGQAASTAAHSTSGPVATAAPTATAVPPAASTVATSREVDRILVFHRTAGFQHASIPAGIDAISELVGVDEILVDSTDDPAIFTDGGLAPFSAVVFLSTTGDVLDPSQQLAMERFVNAGGGFVGVHAAADTEYDWPWYGGLVGAYFASHPAPQPGRVEVLTADHPVTSGLPAEFTVTEEWYDFQAVPAPDVTVLAVVDEGSYEGGTMGAPHPVAWAHEYEGGRAVYVVFGHDDAAFADPTIRQLLDQAVSWAADRPG